MRSNNKDIKRKVRTITAGMGIALLTTGPVFADDTEIYTAYTSTSPNSNVIFVLDTSGSMGNRPRGVNSGPNKIQIVKDVFEKLIFDTTNAQDPTAVNPKTKGLNLAIMRFNQNNSASDSGGRFITRLRQLNNGSKNYFWDAVNGLSANGWTPLAETAYEASRYFDGLAPQFGANSVQGLVTGGSYKSPFEQAINNGQCSINNHLVILTDGMPTNDGNADTAINGLQTNDATCSFSDAQETDCLPNVAKYLYEKDFLPNVDGVQNVVTHTIAFDLDQTAAVQLLNETATNGGGKHLSASTAMQLSDSISDVLTTVVESAKSLVSPATSVSSSNRFTHDNTLYFALFKPDVKPKWLGNLKGYFMDENYNLVDVDGKPALDALGNNFATGTSSKWSNNDGEDIGAGGAAAQILAQPSRNIYTQNGTTLVDINTATAADLGMPNASAPQVSALLDWATSRNTNPIGDPLHSNPQVVNYGGSTGSVIFFGTNEGFIHAIDADSGQEKFAFIPKALLGHLKEFRDGVVGDPHPYGMDGQLTLLVRDADNNGEIDANTNDKVILIAGMRRGGRNYYALDITNPNAPALKWQISGGSGDFADLGQTWSRAVITKLKTGNVDTPTIKDVAVFTGGNDELYDDGSVPGQNDTVTGNAIYAVDLENGNLLWSATTGATASNSESHLVIPDLQHAIPSNPTAMDLDADGTMDRLYAIDVMGRIFRVDFNSTDGTNTNKHYVPTGRLYANLNPTNDDHRFYTAVNTALSQVGAEYRTHLNVGSGRRPNPLNRTITDQFYSVVDTHVFDTTLPSTNDLPVVTVSDLVNTTTDTSGVDHDSKGWYFDLPDTGEKVLSKASTRGGYVFVSTYVPPAPPAPGTQTCEPPLGVGYEYIVAQSNSAALDTTRRVALQSSGIPPAPTFLTLEKTGSQVSDPDNPYISQDSKTILLVGTQKVELNSASAQQALDDALNRTAEKIYWKQN